MSQIPGHLKTLAWYAAHQAWLRDRGLPHHSPGDAAPARANLAGAYLAHAYLAHAYLEDANLAGAYLEDANLAGAYLAHAYLARANLAGANLAGANLEDANLAGANLEDANLAGANLEDANLAGANLAGLPPVPTIANIDAAILAAVEREGCNLDMGEWHNCETTHCRAGWAVHLAGEAGYALEKATSPYLAGRLIYEASRPGVPCPDFFTNNDAALADLKTCAARQSGGAA